MEVELEENVDVEVEVRIGPPPTPHGRVIRSRNTGRGGVNSLI